MRIKKGEFMTVVDSWSSKLVKSNHYLTYVQNCIWDGAPGYRVTKNVQDAFMRDYDVSMRSFSSDDKGKWVKFNEYSHDMPNGTQTIVISLTDDEYDKIKHSVRFVYVSNFVSKFN